jgi:class 3 adenylate cyclase
MKRLHRVESGRESSPYKLPWQEFVMEFISWLIAGFLMVGAYFIFLQAPLSTGIKVMLANISFGLLGGMLCYLSMEKRLILFLRNLANPLSFTPQKILSVSRKMFFLMATVLVLLVSVMILMIFMDINYLLQNRDVMGEEIYQGVFKEMLFAFGVLLALSSVIITRYSRNLRDILGLQLDVMTEISKGNYLRRMPILSNDEFGIIAAKTNEMVEGLKEKDHCQISFGRYMAPEVSEKILRGEVPAEGEIRDATILFCDLRGYTPFVEQNRPQDVVHFLNSYFTLMERAVKEYRGIVLQYIGDEIEAVFGAHEELPNHPEMAVKAALRMRERLNEMNEKRIVEGEAPIAHGIGIHSGEVLAGSVGSPERLVYAMVGDTVNVASRIQDQNKKFGTDILLSEAARLRLKNTSFRFESLGSVSLKGRQEEIELFRLV